MALRGGFELGVIATSSMWLFFVLFSPDDPGRMIREQPATCQGEEGVRGRAMRGCWGARMLRARPAPARLQPRRADTVAEARGGGGRTRGGGVERA